MPLCVTGLLNIWCRRRDLNPHGLRHALKRACLPFHHFPATEAFSVGTLGPVCTHASQSVDGPPCNVDVGPPGKRIIEVVQNACQSTSCPVESDASFGDTSHILSHHSDRRAHVRDDASQPSYFADQSADSWPRCLMWTIPLCSRGKRAKCGFRYLWKRGLVRWREVRDSIGWVLQNAPRCRCIRSAKSLYLAGKPAAEVRALAEEFCWADLFPRVETRAFAHGRTSSGRTPYRDGHRIPRFSDRTARCIVGCRLCWPPAWNSSNTDSPATSVRPFLWPRQTGVDRATHAGFRY